MSIADKQNEDCQEGACEVRFRPIQAARRSFQNLKALATDLIGKVKETLSDDSHDAQGSESADQKEDQQHLDKMQVHTVRESQFSDETNASHLSLHSKDILDRFVQYTGQAVPGVGHLADTGEHLKMVHVRPRPAEDQREAPRYSNPWRYDSPHQ
jgi:hypothetical protein